MIKAIISDFSRVILFPRDVDYMGGLNEMHRKNVDKPGYNFWDHYVLNQELLDFYRKLKSNYPIYIFTTGKIQEYPELKAKLEGVFEGIYTVEDINNEKNVPNAYLSLLQLIKFKPEEVLFIDDIEENIKAAKDAGLNVHLYLDNKELINTINSAKGGSASG
jgi:FMN phosphatase YigB (HAD superfamily)